MDSFSLTKWTHLALGWADPVEKEAVVLCMSGFTARGAKIEAKQ